MPGLNIQQLKLWDYRCFEAIEIDFHERLTILVASNGDGKTAILDAIAVAFVPYVGAFGEGVGKHFEASDVKAAIPTSISSRHLPLRDSFMFLDA